LLPIWSAGCPAVTNRPCILQRSLSQNGPLTSPACVGHLYRIGQGEHQDGALTDEILAFKAVHCIGRHFGTCRRSIVVVTWLPGSAPLALPCLAVYALALLHSTSHRHAGRQSAPLLLIDLFWCSIWKSFIELDVYGLLNLGPRLLTLPPSQATSLLVLSVSQAGFTGYLLDLGSFLSRQGPCQAWSICQTWRGSSSESCSAMPRFSSALSSFSELHKLCLKKSSMSGLPARHATL